MQGHFGHSFLKQGVLGYVGLFGFGNQVLQGAALMCIRRGCEI